MTVLRLREDVLITPYDGRSESERFVAGVDGRHFVISAGLAALLDEMRAPATLESLARRASERTGISITAAELELLLRERVPPVLFQADADPQPLVGPVRFRIRLWRAEALAPVLRRMHVLFSWRAAIASLAALLCVEVLMVANAPSASIHEGFSSQDMMLGAVLTLAGVALHELGHLAACHRFGARHGGIGIGWCWCFPVFYAESHGAWMLPRFERAVVDGAGVYVQCMYLVVVGGLYLCLETPALLIAMTGTHLLLLHALNPVLKFDGYWLLTDLAGVHDVHRRVCGVVREAWFARILPSRVDVGLMLGFAAGAAAYFAYLLHALADGLAGTSSAISLAWDGSISSVALRGGALLFCGAAIVFIAALLAHAVRSVFTETTHDR